MKSPGRLGWILLGCGAAAVIGLGVYLSGGASLVRTPEKATAAGASADEPSRTTVTARGRLEPESEVVSVGAPADGRISRIMVAEGQQVHAGDVLAYLDSRDERIEERDLYDSQIAEARLRFAAETQHSTSLINEAELRIRQLEELRPLEIEEQQYLVNAVGSELARARADLARITRLSKEGVAPEQQLERATLEVQQDEARLKNAEATLQRLKTERSVDLAMAREQLKTAKAELSRSQTLTPIESLVAGRKLAEARLERTIIRAPIDGQILKLVAHAGESMGQGPILRMGNTAQMFAVAEVYETDIAFVRVGQKAEISSPSLSQKLTGTVERLGKSIHRTAVLDIDPASDTDSRVVEVRIKLHQSEPAAALTNLQVRVDIDVR
jgi:HlyD family secretion protein